MCLNCSSSISSGDEQLGRDIAELDHGMALITASPDALRRWFELPSALSGLEGMVAALQADNADLLVEGRLRWQERIKATPWAVQQDLVEGSGGRASLMAQLQDPSRLLDPDELHPLAQWLGPVLKRHLAQQPAALALLELDEGPLLLQQQPEGWLLATSHGQPELSAVDDQLKAQGLAQSDLSGDGESIQVWTRLKRQRGRSAGVEASLAVARSADSNRDWWGETLPSLVQRQESRALEPRLQQWRNLSRHQSTPRPSR